MKKTPIICPHESYLHNYPWHPIFPGWRREWQSAEISTDSISLEYEAWFSIKFPQALALLWHQIYSSNWDHMKGLNLLFKWGYSSLISNQEWLSERPKCRMTLVNAGTTQAKTVRKTTVLEWCENMKCLSLSGCHLAVSQSWASYHTSSERGESELPADQKFFEFLTINSYFQAYFWVGPASAKLTHILVCHSVISCQISGYYTPI